MNIERRALQFCIFFIVGEIDEKRIAYIGIVGIKISLQKIIFIW